MTSTGNRKKNPDRNSAVKEGMIISGYFSKKLKTAMVVSYALGDSKRCSGVLHVSQFPAGTRKIRDKYFKEAKVGMRVFDLRVIKSTPPSGNRTYTSIRLSARGQ